MALIDELRTRWNVRHAEFTRLEATVDKICNELQDLEVAIAALADPDIAAAALTSQETFDFEAPAQADPPSELRDAPPAASEESGDQFETTESDPDAGFDSPSGETHFDATDEAEARDPVLRAFEDDHIVAPSLPIDEQTCEPVDPRVSWSEEPAATDDEPPALDESELGPRPEDTSILNDPELIAGVERAQETLDAAEGYAPVVARRLTDEEVAATLGPQSAFLNSIMERGGMWHDGGDNPAPDWFCDIYVPSCATIHGESHELQGQPSNAYEWNGWEVAYVKTKPMAHATSPAADEAAAAHDYYAPENVAKRDRFNPFGMFHKRETEEV